MKSTGEQTLQWQNIVLIDADRTENGPARRLFSVTLTLESTGASQDAAQDAQAAASEAVAKYQGVRRRMENARDAVETIVNIVGLIAELNPIAQAAVEVVKAALEALKNQKQVDELVEKLVLEMGDVLPLLAAVENHTKIQKLQDTTRELLLLVEAASQFIIEYMSGSPLARAIPTPGSSEAQDRVNGFVNDFERLKANFGLGMTAQVVKKLLDKLVIPGAVYSINQACWKGTRELVIRDIQQWMLNDTGSSTFYWLYGPAGCGKSSIATSVSKALDEGEVLTVNFFCRRDSAELSQPENVISQLAHSLAYKCPTYREKLVEALQTNPNLPGAPTSEIRYQGLMDGPLRSIEQNAKLGRLVVIVDAIDESGTPETRRDLTNCLLKLSRAVNWLKVFVTSRPKDEIREPIESQQENTQTRNLFSEDEDNVSRDIATYIRARLSGIKDTGREQWPNEDDAKGLAARSNGLFIWASTACWLIEKSDDPPNTLDQIRDGQRSKNEREALSKLYTTALNEGLRAANINEDTFKLCVGAIVLTGPRRPLPEVSLAAVLEIKPHQLSRVINCLGAVLRTDQGVVRVLHHSFSDYMTGGYCAEEYRIDLAAQNAKLAALCLKLMIRKLDFNICSLQDSSAMNCDVADLQSRIKDKITPQLRYSCTYWISHLVDSARATGSSGVIELMDKLMCREHLIYWIEVLSLTGELHIITENMARLIDWIKDAESKYTKIAEDVYRFVLAAYEAISSSTPHLYVSALPFGAANFTTIRALAPKFPNTLSLTSGMDIWNSPCLRIIQTQGAVNSISVSPDGRRIVSASMDKTLRVWDARTGASLRDPLSGHSEAVTSVAFSHDSRCIVSGSRDKTLRIWDTEKGNAVLRLLKGHSGWVLSVAFSSDGRRIVSGSDDRTVRMWDAQEGTAFLNPFKGHEGAVMSVAISFDGALVASGSSDQTIRIWNARTADSDSCDPLKGHTNHVTSVAFSPNGRYIVSGSQDKTVRVWDAEAGTTLFPPLLGHSDWVTAVAFSPDGRRIVSCSNDGSARVWDARNGSELLSPLEGHSGYMSSAAFSPDGRCIITGSWDEEVRIWDAQECANLLDPLPGHSYEVTSVAYSSDGQSIVSGSQDKTVRIWNAHTGDARLEPFQAHSEGVTSVAFSPDNKHIASGSTDETIRIWNAQTGEMILGPLKGHSDVVASVAFSPDGRQIVSGSWDTTVQTCDTDTGEFRPNPIKGHFKEVACAAFSPDGQLIVSGSDDKTARVWNAHTGDSALKPLRGHSKRVTSVAFSPDAKLIISGSMDTTVRIWDAHSGIALRLLNPPGNQQDAIESVAFSPNSLHVVSGSRDTTLCIWDTTTGALLLGPLRGHSKSVTSVAFSPDGQRIVSGSDDGSVRTWDSSAPGSSSSTHQTLEFSGRFVAMSSASVVRVLMYQLCRVSSREISGLLRKHWVYKPSGERLFWVPPAYQQQRVDHSLMAISVNPHDHHVVYDLSGLKTGTQWTEVKLPKTT
ncbi:hypothetical protein FRC09_003938 [Ceratobasidium sp. 395]|nr:hypothetical protein FRC09_003938 [Ceratobasidium sp. 395]